MLYALHAVFRSTALAICACVIRDVYSSSPSASIRPASVGWSSSACAAALADAPIFDSLLLMLCFSLWLPTAFELLPSPRSYRLYRSFSSFVILPPS